MLLAQYLHVWLLLVFHIQPPPLLSLVFAHVNSCSHREHYCVKLATLCNILYAVAVQMIELLVID